MKNYKILFLFLISILISQDASISNVTVAQRTDGSKIVDINYDLNGDSVFPSFDVRVYANNTPNDNNCTYAPEHSAESEWLCGYNLYGQNWIAETAADGVESPCACDAPSEEANGECYSSTCNDSDEVGQNPAREFLCTEFEGEEYCQLSGMSGNIYENIIPGANKHITWDLKNTFSSLELDNMKLKIMITGHEITENIPFEMANISAGSYYSNHSSEMEEILYDYEIMLKEVTNAEYVHFLILQLEHGNIELNVCPFNEDMINDPWGEVIDRYGNYYSASECASCHDVSDLCNEEYFSVMGQIFYGNEYLKPSIKYPYMFFDYGNSTFSDGNQNKISFNGTTFLVAEGYGNHPVTNVTWVGANAFSKYYGMRLPSSNEWERAAIGDTSNVISPNWPWGNDYYNWDYYDYDNDQTSLPYANFNEWCEFCSDDEWFDGFDLTSPVGFYNGTNIFPDTSLVTLDGRSLYGLYDMAGNVAEYNDEFEYYDDENCDQCSSYKPVIRGGSYRYPIEELEGHVSTQYILFENNYDRRSSTGFRCARTK